jgi:hypothetical protein
MFRITATMRRAPLKVLPRLRTGEGAQGEARQDSEFFCNLLLAVVIISPGVLAGFLNFLLHSQLLSVLLS